MSMTEDGKYVCDISELLHFVEAGREIDAHGNTLNEYWWQLHKDGSFTVDSEPDKLPSSWPVPLMSWPGDAWIEQWGGDLQKAIDQQIQPALDKVHSYFSEAPNGV